jgi:exodeoxyribonuclease-3
MKITTWNVNGIRAVLNKGFAGWVQAHRPDVLCLQEVKARPEQLPAEQQQLGDYTAIWHPAERPGYSGVATFLRQPAQAFEVGIGNHLYDVEGRVIQTLHPGFRLFNVYFPNGGRGLERVAYKLDFYAELLSLCDRLHAAGEKVVITGDFNTAHREIDLARPRQNVMNTGFLPEERLWLDHYLEHGFVDAYRQLYPEKVEYTWWSYVTNARVKNVGWRLDFFMVSRGLLPAVQDVVVHADVPGSDHCPVTLLLDDSQLE